MKAKPRQFLPLLLVLLVCGLGFVPLVWAQWFSPGKLTQAHKHLSGLRNCKKCHVSGRTISAAKCLKCHGPLAKRIRAGKGYHGKMPKSQLNKCGRCHTDHKGRSFSIIFWPGRNRKKFPHAKTGYPLVHKHLPVDCRKCHRRKYIRDASVRRYAAKWKQLDKTYLGLSQTCKSCHKDPHRGEVKGACNKCHSEKGWSNAHRFSHAKTRFPLRHKHAAVACTKCHKPLAGGGKGALKFKMGRDCKTCHSDPHGGKMTTRCERCHTEKGWKQSIFAKASHARGKFPLTGAHLSQDCTKCHGKKLDKALRRACISCHKTPHSPSFSKRCQTCHNTTSWLKSSFSRAQHQKTRFPLKGKHMQVACTKCHKVKKGAKKARGKSRYRMKPEEFSNCSPCHKDVHKGQFARDSKTKMCKTCHTEEHFKPSLFGIKAHAKTQFPLTHSHLAVPCSGCHKRPKKEPTAAVVYKIPKPQHTCKFCHNDPHKGRFDKVVRAKGCKGCHSIESWHKVDVERFDHSMTAFNLTGKHKTLKCIKCHPFKRRKNGRVLPHYRGRPTDCSGCHKDIHYGQFQVGVQKKVNCGRCHTTKEWKKASRFNHDAARFKLTGKHKSIKCQQCHKSKRLPNQKQVTHYRPIKHANCVDCHRNYHTGGSR